MQLQRLRESLVILLLVLLPFHAFGVTVVTKLLEGPGHAPLGWLAVWKEGLLMLILLLAVLDRRWWKRILPLDAVDSLVILLAALAVAIGMRDGAIPSTGFIYGFRYDLLLPLAFLVLRRSHWGESFPLRALTAVLWSGVVVAVAGLILLILPISALQTLGYNDLHSLYVSAGPLAPFQQIGETGIRRMQSVMSGPNQLGLWMLLPFSIALLRRKWVSILFALCIVLSFSRSAWIAAAVITVIVAWKMLPEKKRGAFVGGGVLTLILLVAGVFALKPDILTRATSTNNHIVRPLHAIRTIVAHPLGLGLGSAGPAANHGSDTCIDLPAGSDASWAAAHPDLCVFVGEKQVQPTAPCSCPLLPENWFLQIGVELGALGMIVYLALVCLLLKKLPFGAVPLAFLGVCIAGLFLHSFEDFGVATTLWMLAAISLASRRR